MARYLKPHPMVAPQSFFPLIDIPLNSRIAATQGEEAQLEVLVHEMIQLTPDYAEQLALDGLNRMREG
jgi:hypothetical protein